MTLLNRRGAENAKQTQRNDSKKLFSFSSSLRDLSVLCASAVDASFLK